MNPYIIAILYIFSLCLPVILFIKLLKKVREVAELKQELHDVQEKLRKYDKNVHWSRLGDSIIHYTSQPITTIFNLSKFLKERMAKEDPFYKHTALVQEQAEVLYEIFKNIAELVRHKERRVKQVSINEIIQKMMLLLSDEFKTQHVQFSTALKENCPRISVDPISLQMVFMDMILRIIPQNVTSSSSEYFSFKVVSDFDVEMRKVTVVFEIDNMHVITEEGMHICHDMIIQHGGQVSIENHPSQGSKITYEFVSIE